jgi:hypothetical protein
MRCAASGEGIRHLALLLLRPPLRKPLPEAAVRELRYNREAIACGSCLSNHPKPHTLSFTSSDKANAAAHALKSNKLTL